MGYFPSTSSRYFHVQTPTEADQRGFLLLAKATRKPKRLTITIFKEWLSGPGQREIQADLLYDYRTNVASYSVWQAWLRERKPPTLVVWGRNDPSFIAPGAEAFERDLPDAEIHLLDAGHFALDEKNDEIASLILAFLAKHSV
jgi:pimeloyl-ACP methyl ester carboxylesterase